MGPLFLTLTSGTTLKVIPDASVYHDGHPIITYTYSLFHNRKVEIPDVEGKVSAEINSDYVNHPDYVGFITFEDPGKLFTYTSYGDEPLTLDESQEAIEQISHIRDNPQTWPFADKI